MRYYRYIVAFYITIISIQWGCPMCKETGSLTTSFLPPNSLCRSCLPLKYTAFSICLILVFPFDKSPTKLVMVLLPSVALALITDLSFRNHLAVVLRNFLPLTSNTHVELFTLKRLIMPLKLQKHFKISPILHSPPKHFINISNHVE